MDGVLYLIYLLWLVTLWSWLIPKIRRRLWYTNNKFYFFVLNSITWTLLYDIESSTKINWNEWFKFNRISDDGIFFCYIVPLVAGILVKQNQWRNTLNFSSKQKQTKKTMFKKNTFWWLFFPKNYGLYVYIAL